MLRLSVIDNKKQHRYKIKEYIEIFRSPLKYYKKLTKFSKSNPS